jgi:HPt (histidine-containing phosphotransfer) domain-containing protein
MDLQMPLLGGIEATGIIRDRETASGSHTPIIAMTAHALKGDRERCLAAGMDDYLSKPIEPEDLFAALERATDRAVAPVHPPPRPPPEVPTPAAAGAGAPARPCFDLSTLLRRVGGDRELLREVVGLFLDSAPDLMGAVREAVESGTAPALERAAHSLKGSAANLGAESVREASFALEQIGRENRLAAALPALARLESELNQLCDTLRGLRQPELTCAS